MTYDAVEQFQEMLNPFLPDFKSLDVRIIATLQQIGYVFEAVRILLEPTRGRVTHANLPKSKELIAIHAKWDVDRIPEVLEALRKGEIEVDGVLIHLKRRVSVDKWIPLDNLYHRDYNKDSAQARFGMNCFCIALEGYDSANLDSVNRTKLDNYLRCERIPWDGIDDLKRMFAKQSRSWTQGTSFLEVIAPVGVKFGRKSLIGKQRMELGVRAMPSADQSRISITCLARCKGEVVRIRRVLSRRVSRAVASRRQFVIHLPTQYEWAKCILMYRGWEVDRYEMSGSDRYNLGPKWGVFTEVTSGIESLMTLPSGKHLEVHLEVLFHLLGFYTVHYGGISWPGEKSPPDIVAFPNKGDWLIVLECTSRESDIHNKLGKLSTRSKELSIAADGLTVYPVVFTALRREVITKTDLEKASKERISLVTADDLQKLLDAAKSKKSDEEVLAILQQLVPSDL